MACCWTAAPCPCRPAVRPGHVACTVHACVDALSTQLCNCIGNVYCPAITPAAEGGVGRIQQNDCQGMLLKVLWLHNGIYFCIQVHGVSCRWMHVCCAALQTHNCYLINTDTASFVVPQRTNIDTHLGCHGDQAGCPAQARTGCCRPAAAGVGMAEPWTMTARYSPLDAAPLHLRCKVLHHKHRSCLRPVTSTPALLLRCCGWFSSVIRLKTASLYIPRSQKFLLLVIRLSARKAYRRPSACAAVTDRSGRDP